MGDTPVTLYAVFRQIITVTYYNGNTTASSMPKRVTLESRVKATPLLYVIPLLAVPLVLHPLTVHPLYGRYSQTITLSYNGNGASGGSTAAQTGTRYWNTGNLANPSFALRTNGFTRTGYNAGFTVLPLPGQ